MGIYGEWAEKYAENNLFCIPCNDKKAPILGNNWQDYCDSPPQAEDISQWAKEFHYSDRLGLLLGKSTGVVAFDFDYEYDEKKMKISREEFEKDKTSVEKQILALLPHSPCIKVGQKGWTRFYKWSEKNKNIQVDRNGVRLFDFLAWHKQTIIPPSLHSMNRDANTSIHYRWVNEPLEDCMNSLEEITQDTIVTLNEVFSTGDIKTKFNTRHGRIFLYINDILEIEKDESKIITKALEYDKKVNSPPYLTDERHVGSNSEKYLNNWISRIKRFKSVSPKKNKKLSSSTTWDYFFENKFLHCRKDILTDKIHVKRLDKDPWVVASDIAGAIRCYAADNGLNRAHVMDELERWNLEKNEKGLLIDFPNWDGSDRVRLFANSIHSPVFSHDEIYEILCDWGAKLFHRIYSKNSPIQNRCPIFRGGQGIGKDTLVRNLLEGFRPYYQSVNLSGTQKDMLEVVSRLLVIHIEEFDQTSNVPIAFLKDLITKPQVFFRESYGRSPQMRDMMASWISTANVEDVLRDPTGNRRFILIPVDKIEWDYPKQQSSQVYAQFYNLYKTGVNYTSEGTEKKIIEILNDYTPDDMSEMILDNYKQRILDLSKSQAYKEEYSYPELSSMFQDISKQSGCSVRRVLMIVKAAGYQQKIKNTRMYLTKPNRRIYTKSTDNCGTDTD